MKKKLKLQDLKVSSFVTNENAKNVLGGGSVAGICGGGTSVLTLVTQDVKCQNDNGGVLTLVTFDTNC